MALGWNTHVVNGRRVPGTLTMTLTADTSRFQEAADAAAAALAAAEWHRFLQAQRATGRSAVEQQADAARSRLGLPSGVRERELAEWHREWRMREIMRMHVLAGLAVHHPRSIASVS